MSSRYTKKGCDMFCFNGVMMHVYALAIIGLFIGLLAGGHYSTQSMTRKMDVLNEPIQGLFGSLSKDDKLDHIISNFQQLSEPESIKKLMEKAEEAFSSVHGSDIAQFASLAEHANLLMSQIDMARINLLLDNVNKLNPDQLNKFLETTIAIEQKLKELHEFKINI